MQPRVQLLVKRLCNSLIALRLRKEEVCLALGSLPLLGTPIVYNLGDHHHPYDDLNETDNNNKGDNIDNNSFVKSKINSNVATISASLLDEFPSLLTPVDATMLRQHTRHLVHACTLRELSLICSGSLTLKWFYDVSYVDNMTNKGYTALIGKVGAEGAAEVNRQNNSIWKTANDINGERTTELVDDEQRQEQQSNCEMSSGFSNYVSKEQKIGSAGSKTVVDEDIGSLLLFLAAGKWRVPSYGARYIAQKSYLTMTDNRSGDEAVATLLATIVLLSKMNGIASGEIRSGNENVQQNTDGLYDRILALTYPHWARARLGVKKLSWSGIGSFICAATLLSFLKRPEIIGFSQEKEKGSLLTKRDNNSTVDPIVQKSEQIMLSMTKALITSIAKESQTSTAPLAVLILSLAAVFVLQQPSISSSGLPLLSSSWPLAFPLIFADSTISNLIQSINNILTQNDRKFISSDTDSSNSHFTKLASSPSAFFLGCNKSESHPLLTCSALPERRYRCDTLESLAVPMMFIVSHYVAIGRFKDGPLTKVVSINNINDGSDSDNGTCHTAYTNSILPSVMDDYYQLLNLALICCPENAPPLAMSVISSFLNVWRNITQTTPDLPGLSVLKAMISAVDNTITSNVNATLTGASSSVYDAREAVVGWCENEIMRRKGKWGATHPLLATSWEGKKKVWGSEKDKEELLERWVENLRGCMLHASKAGIKDAAALAVMASALEKFIVFVSENIYDNEVGKVRIVTLGSMVKRLMEASFGLPFDTQRISLSTLLTRCCSSEGKSMTSDMNGTLSSSVFFSESADMSVQNTNGTSNSELTSLPLPLQARLLKDRGELISDNLFVEILENMNNYSVKELAMFVYSCPDKCIEFDIIIDSIKNGISELLAEEIGLLLLACLESTSLHAIMLVDLMAQANECVTLTDSGLSLIILIKAFASHVAKVAKESESAGVDEHGVPVVIASAGSSFSTFHASNNNINKDGESMIQCMSSLLHLSTGKFLADVSHASLHQVCDFMCAFAPLYADHSSVFDKATLIGAGGNSGDAGVPLGTLFPYSASTTDTFAPCFVRLADFVLIGKKGVQEETRNSSSTLKYMSGNGPFFLLFNDAMKILIAMIAVNTVNPILIDLLVEYLKTELQPTLNGYNHIKIGTMKNDSIPCVYQEETLDMCVLRKMNSFMKAYVLFDTPELDVLMRLCLDFCVNHLSSLPSGMLPICLEGALFLELPSLAAKILFQLDSQCNFLTIFELNAVTKIIAHPMNANKLQSMLLSSDGLMKGLVKRANQLITAVVEHDIERGGSRQFPYVVDEEFLFFSAAMESGGAMGVFRKQVDVATLFIACYYALGFTSTGIDDESTSLMAKKDALSTSQIKRDASEKNNNTTALSHDGEEVEEAILHPSEEGRCKYDAALPLPSFDIPTPSSIVVPEGIADYIVQHIDEYTANEACLIMASMPKFTINSSTEPLLQALLSRISVECSQATPHLISEAIFGAGETGLIGPHVNHHIAVIRLSDHCVDHVEQWTSGHAICRLVYGFSNVQLRKRNFYNVFASRLIHRPLLMLLSQVDISLVMKGFGNAKYLDKRLFDNLALRCISVSDQLNAADLTLILSGYSRMNLLNAPLYQKLGERVEAIAPTLPLPAALQLLKAYGYIGIRHDSMTAALLTHVTDNLEKMDINDVVDVVYYALASNYDSDFDPIEVLADKIAERITGVHEASLDKLCEIMTELHWRNDKLLIAVANQSTRLTMGEALMDGTEVENGPVSNGRMSPETSRVVLDTLAMFLVHHGEARRLLTDAARTISRDPMLSESVEQELQQRQILS